MMSDGLEIKSVDPCDVSSSDCPKIESKIECVLRVLMINVSEGSLPWRFNTVSLKVFPMEIEKHYIIQYEGLEMSQFR